MKKFMDWLENSFAPKMNKVGRNSYILAVKDSIMQILPFILVGSLFCMFTIIEGYLHLPFTFWQVYGWSMGMIGLLVSFLIPLNFCEKKRLRSAKVVASSAGLILFLMFITPKVTADGTVGFGSQALGAGGMFVAIVAGLISSAVFSLFSKISFFKEDSAIPDFVRQWFDSLLPLAILIFGSFLLVFIANVDIFGIVVSIFSPLKNVLNTWYGLILFSLISLLLYSMGISFWVLAPITETVMLNSVAENMAMVANGITSNAALNIFTKTTVTTVYGAIGGTGSTLALAIMMALSKSKRLRTLGRASVVPSIFNINEPVVFAAIAWNPIMMIPLLIISVVEPIFMWVMLKVVQFAPIPTIQFDLWYCPKPIATWIGTQGSVTAIIYIFVLFALTWLIWLPFFKVYEKQCLTEEAEKE